LQRVQTVTVAFSDGRLTQLSAAPAHHEMGLAITAAADAAAVSAVGQRLFCSAPPAARSLHAMMFSGQDVEKSTQR
jgi:hypothetical protein